MWLCLMMGRWSWAMVLEFTLLGSGSGCLVWMDLLGARYKTGSCCWMAISGIGDGNKLVCYVVRGCISDHVGHVY